METNRATEQMANGLVCAESVLLATCEELSIEIAEDITPKIAFAFAGGIGNTGSVCGAVVGAVMAIGLIRDRGKTTEEMFEVMGLAAEFRKRFEAKMGTISCRELTGLDLTQVEGQKELSNSDVAEKVCFPAVAAAFRIVVDLLGASA